MNPTDKKALFICSITESSIKLVKYSLNAPKGEFSGLELEALPADADKIKLAQALSSMFKRLGYSNNRLILSLPLSQATYRYLKVPSLLPDEIEEIASLQAARFLPYAAAELVTGYQSLFSDKENYSHINLAIVHKAAIERYLEAFHSAGIRRPDIFLSCYGLLELYAFLRPSDTSSLMVIDIDAGQAEAAIISRKKMLFGRYFKLNKTLNNWENTLVEEINKTRDTYLKESGAEPPRKIVLLAKDASLKQVAGETAKKIDLPVEVISYAGEIRLSSAASEKLRDSDTSFTALFGLAQEELPFSLNLLPKEIKKQAKRSLLAKERLKSALLATGVIMILAAAAAKSLDNKSLYLARLNAQLNAVSREARPLEEIEKRIKLLGSRAQKSASGLDIIYELHKKIPPEASLISLSYEEGAQAVLRGEASRLNSVFEFASSLEESPVFKSFEIKVRYATRRKVQGGERIDFEITCVKR